MIIYLTESQRIRGTEHCYQTERRYRCNGEYEWKAFKYHTTLSQSVRAAAEREIRTIPTNTLSEWIEAADQVIEKFEQILRAQVESRQVRVDRLKSVA